MRAARREPRRRLPGRMFATAFAFALLACESPSPAPAADVSAEITAGELALARGELDAATRHFEKALAAGSGAERALMGLARTRVASGDLDAALALFEEVELTRIRDAGPASFWDYCTAVMGTGEKRLAEGRFQSALDLARRGEADGCGSYRAHELSLRARVDLAAEARLSGDPERALDLYLEVLGPGAMKAGFRPAAALRSQALGPESPNAEDEARLRAYRGAAAILLESGRREETLSLLYGALMRFPDDTALVELMVDGLAQPSGTQPKEHR